LFRFVLFEAKQKISLSKRKGNEVKRSVKSKVKQNKSSEVKKTMQKLAKNYFKRNEGKTASIYFAVAVAKVVDWD
jgi:hypothetical protein